MGNTDVKCELTRLPRSGSHQIPKRLSSTPELTGPKVGLNQLLVSELTNAQDCMDPSHHRVAFSAAAAGSVLLARPYPFQFWMYQCLSTFTQLIVFFPSMGSFSSYVAFLPLASKFGFASRIDFRT